MTRVAVLGWGSLVTHPAGDSALGQTPLASTGDWSLDGPKLKLELARVSAGRRLTLVVDEMNGVENQVYTIQSAHDSLDAAAENLRLREGPTRKSWIGRLAKGDAARTETEIVIATWLAQSAYDAVVWTAIPPNFLEALTHPFTVDAAIGHLFSLADEERRRARAYITEIPDAISTAVRKNAYWPETVALHEAGHYVVACSLGRPVLRLSRVPVADKADEAATIGCRYAEGDYPEAVRYAGDFAGALVQVVHFPESIASWKLPTFTRSILLPRDQHQLYGWTSWAEDLRPALTAIAYPYASTLSATDIQRLERQVADFLRVGEIVKAIHHTRDVLVATPVLTGEPLKALHQEVNALIAPVTGKHIMLAGF